MDVAKAKALEIAERQLDRLGWKYTAEDVGHRAACILKSLDKELSG